MPRTPRLDHPGARHHVMNRSARKEPIFITDDDCVLFLSTLAEVPERFGAKIHGYALMPNHFHLLLEVPSGNLSEVMKYVGASFTQAYNRTHDHDGPLFRGRFHNALVDDEAYWTHLLAYLHLNPVKGGLCKRAEDCVWTSHNAYIGESMCPEWLTRDEMLAHFGSPKALATYVDDVRRKRRSDPDSFDAERLWRTSTSPSKPVAPPWIPRTADEAIGDVARVLGVQKKKVLLRKIGSKPNLSAWLATWWLHRGAGLSLTKIGQMMGVSRPRVGVMRDKLFEHARKDAEARRAIDELRQFLP